MNNVRLLHFISEALLLILFSQMPEPVTGTMTCINGNKFTAVFKIKPKDAGEVTTYTFSGDWTSNVQDFSVPSAKLDYDNIQQLTAVHPITGTIGIDDVDFTIENGPKITGALKNEVDPAVSVKGTGAWESHN